MRKPEQRLWDRFSDNCAAPGMWLQRVENGVVVGMPDVLVIHRGWVAWVELKYAPRPMRETTRLLGARGLTAEQRNWHKDWQESGGASYVLIGDDKRELYLIDGHYGDDVNDMTLGDLRRLRVAADWSGVRKELTQH